MPEEKWDKTVLVVDDSRTYRKGLVDALRRTLPGILPGKRIAIAEAGSAKEALGIMIGMSFNLVISDLNMPGLDGFEFLNCCLEKPNFLHRTRFILVSADDSAMARVVAQAKGATFILKDESTLIMEEAQTALA